MMMAESGFHDVDHERDWTQTGAVCQGEDEGARISSSLSRLGSALRTCRDERQRAAVRFAIAAHLRKIGLCQEASYMVVEADLDLKRNSNDIKMEAVSPEP